MLMLAYFFPPLGGAGVQRTLKFVQVPRAVGWEATVVSTRSRYYPARDESLLRRSRRPRAWSGRRRSRSLTGWASSLYRLRLKRLFAADLAGRRVRLGAVRARGGAARRPAGAPDVIYSTSPPQSGHLAALHRASPDRDPVGRGFPRRVGGGRASRRPAADARARCGARRAGDHPARAPGGRCGRLLSASPVSAASDPRRVVIVNGVDEDDLPDRRGSGRRPTGSCSRTSGRSTAFATRRRCSARWPTSSRAARSIGDRFEVRLVGSMWLEGFAAAGRHRVEATGYVEHARAVEEMCARDSAPALRPEREPRAVREALRVPRVRAADPLLRPNADNLASRLVRRVGRRRRRRSRRRDAIEQAILALWRRWEADGLPRPGRRCGAGRSSNYSRRATAAQLARGPRARRAVADALRVLVAGWLNSPHVKPWAAAVEAAGHEVHVAGRSAPQWPPAAAGANVHVLRVRRAAARSQPAHEPCARASCGGRSRPISFTRTGCPSSAGWRRERISARWSARPGALTSSACTDSAAAGRGGRSTRRELVFADSEHLARATRGARRPRSRWRSCAGGSTSSGTRRGTRPRHGAPLGLDPTGRLIVSVRGLRPDLQPRAAARGVRAGRDATSGRAPAAQAPAGAGAAGGRARRSSGLGSRARSSMLGSVAVERMPDVYRAADVVVSIPSSDSSPRSVWEALACGRPVVVSDLPWAREELEHGRRRARSSPSTQPSSPARSSGPRRRRSSPDARRGARAGGGRAGPGCLHGADRRPLPLGRRRSAMSTPRRHLGAGAALSVFVQGGPLLAAAVAQHRPRSHDRPHRATAGSRCSRRSTGITALVVSLGLDGGDHLRGQPPPLVGAGAFRTSYVAALVLGLVGLLGGLAVFLLTHDSVFDGIANGPGGRRARQRAAGAGVPVRGLRSCSARERYEGYAALELSHAAGAAAGRRRAGHSVRADGRGHRAAGRRARRCGRRRAAS